MLLTQLENNDESKIDRLDLDDTATRKLAARGLLSGCHVRMLRKKKGVVLIEYRGTFLALSQNIAEKIYVTPKGE